MQLVLIIIVYLRHGWLWRRGQQLPERHIFGLQLYCDRGKESLVTTACACTNPYQENMVSQFS